MVFVIDRCGLEPPLSEYVKILSCKCPGAKFIVLDNANDKEEIVRLLIMGIHGYVPHEEAQKTLARAVFSVAADDLWVPPEVFQKLLTEVSSVRRGRVGQVQHFMTPREHEILELVRRRLSNREIADLLQIRVSTVKFHLSNILSKLNASSRRELTATSLPKARKFIL